MPLGKPVSDHIPCIVTIESKIPKWKLFRFENFWINQEGFSHVVAQSWSKPCFALNSASLICKKLKNLRYDLKQWSKGISRLKILIQNSNEVLLFLDDLEDHRGLFLQEANFRSALKKHLNKLLSHQNEYWRKRCTIRYFRFADKNTKLFQALATERFRHNSIASLRHGDAVVLDHAGKEGILYTSYKERLGTSKPTTMQFDLVESYAGLRGLRNYLLRSHMMRLMQWWKVCRLIGRLAPMASMGVSLRAAGRQ